VEVVGTQGVAFNRKNGARGLYKEFIFIHI